MKKKLNWEKTALLIDKYERKANHTPTRGVPQTPTTKSTPTRKPRLVTNTDTPSKKNDDMAQTPVRKQKDQVVSEEPSLDSTRNEPTTSTPQPQTGGNTNSIVNRLLDYIIGDSPSTSFALICEKCHANNGLIPSDEKDNVQFYCKKCGHYNMSKKRKQQFIYNKSIKESIEKEKKDSENESTDNDIVEEIEDNSDDEQVGTGEKESLTNEPVVRKRGKKKASKS